MNDYFCSDIFSGIAKYREISFGSYFLSKNLGEEWNEDNRKINEGLVSFSIANVEYILHISKEFATISLSLKSHRKITGQCISVD